MNGSHRASVPTLLRLFAGLAACSVAPGLAAKPPPVSPAVEKLIHALFQRPEIEYAQLSPDGKYIAFWREESGSKVLATINLETKAVSATSGNRHGGAYDFYWCGPETLVFKTGNELWLIDGRLRDPVNIPIGDKGLIVYQIRQPYVFLVDRNQQHNEGLFSDLYRLDSRTGELVMAVKNPGRAVDWLADESGVVRFAVRALTEDRYELLYRKDSDSPWNTLPLPKRPVPLDFDRSGNFLLLQFEGENGRAEVQAFDLAKHQLVGTALSDPVYDVMPSIRSDPKTGAPAGLNYLTSRAKVYWLEQDYARLQATLAPVFPGSVTQPWGTIYNGKVLFTTYSDTSPYNLYLFDPKTGKASLFLPVLPETRGMRWAPMREITFKARDGYPLHGYLTLPSTHQDGRRIPLIALSHGGPRVRDVWGFDTEVQFFAALGYGVLQVNYRGSTGFGRAHELANIIQVCHFSVDDVADGLSWAVAQGYGDPKRLAVMGSSYGGYISLALAERDPELPAAVVAFAGVYDWEKQIKLDAYEQTELFHWRDYYFPDVKLHAAEYRAVSPVHLAELVRAPVLLLHGSEDQVVDIKQSKLMEKALRKAGKSVRLVANVASIHGLPDQQSRFDYYQTVAAFLLEHVPPDKLP